MSSQAQASGAGYPARPLTLDDLHTFSRHFASIWKDDVGPIVYWISANILHHLLGDEWVNNNLNPFCTTVDRNQRESRAFLGPDAPSGMPTHRLIHRTSLLASHLFSFQGMEGFEYVVEEIRQIHLISKFDELICAGLARKAGATLRFVQPTKVQNVSFPDFEILWGAGQVINVEVEGKDGDTTLTQKTLGKSLKHAQQQLPANQPGIVFVRLPQEWAALSDMQDWMQQETDRIFGKSHRVVAIVWLWTEGDASADDLEYQGRTCHRVHISNRSRLLTPDLKDFLLWMFSSERTDWVSIIEIASKFAAP
jgi:hypothetical protein